MRERNVEGRHAISQVSGLQVSVAQRGLHRGVPQDLPHLGQRSPRLDHPGLGMMARGVERGVGDTPFMAALVRLLIRFRISRLW